MTDSRLGLPRSFFKRLLEDTANECAHASSPGNPPLVLPASQAQFPQTKDPKRKSRTERSQAQDLKPKFPNQSS